jgi:hypothetical protein
MSVVFLLSRVLIYRYGRNVCEGWHLVSEMLEMVGPMDEDVVSVALLCYAGSLGFSMGVSMSVIVYCDDVFVARSVYNVFLGLEGGVCDTTSLLYDYQTHFIPMIFPSSLLKQSHLVPAQLHSPSHPATPPPKSE